MSEQFDPKRAVKNIGKNSPQLYLQVKDRVRWFREENPKGKIKADVLVLDIERGYASVKATVTNEAGGEADNYGSAWRDLLLDRAKQQRRPDAEMIAGDFLEWATTSAIGRALAGLGYGTEDALDFDMSAPADAPSQAQASEMPQEPRNRPQATPNPPPRPNGARPPADVPSDSLPTGIVINPGKVLDIVAAGRAFREAADQAGYSTREAQDKYARDQYPGRRLDSLTVEDWRALELKCRAMYSDVPAPEEAPIF